ncbi:uncharacterized protein LOC106636505 [Copidosoma floridanum]|uniref:uncharacterized protein LOC106636505 n=1 Tax=Copidosoma floridanum TaxID=29053 RepID=UPI000C6FB53B|nr:uncharacterized protein LOC106636505 [Copidosoma floridanum]
MPGDNRSGRRKSRRDSLEAGGANNNTTTSSSGATPSRCTPPGSRERRSSVRRGVVAGKPIKERWLLTRKTWRAMQDCGRRLIPDSVITHRIPKIEQYFQEVCSRESKFLLWRKASYPGSLGFRAARRGRRHPSNKPGGSCRLPNNKQLGCSNSADEAEDSRLNQVGPHGGLPSAGKLDLARVKREWLLSSSSAERRRQPREEAEAKALADMLQKYLNMQSERSSSVSTDHSMGSAGLAKEPTTAITSSSGLDYQKLIEKLEQHLNQIMAEGRREAEARTTTTTTTSSSYSSHAKSRSTTTTSACSVPKITMPYQSDFVHKSLLETLSRYYSKSPNREHVISDILTDRKLLEKLYFDLRCTRGFRGPRATGAYTSPSARWWNQQQPSTRLSKPPQQDGDGGRPSSTRRDLMGSPPPLIAVQGPSTERGPIDSGTQTEPVARELLDALLLEREAADHQASTPPPNRDQPHKTGRRRSSVDNDDVSPSVSDTIKRYLRMARKKSMDSDKADRFKRVNYDRNLRNIRPKGETTRPSDPDDAEPNTKACQTGDAWPVGYREMAHHEPGEVLLLQLSDADTTSPVSRNASSRSSMDASGLGSEDAAPPSTPSKHQSFLSHLLHGSSSSSSSHGATQKPHSAPGSPAMATCNTNNSNGGGGGGAMQKSKSSSSVVHHGSRLVAKKIWKSRSKSSSRAINLVSTWTPQGKCTWAGTNGRRVTLQDTPLRSLSEVERKVLCRVAVAKLQALNLGVHIRPPTESLSGGSVTAKPKRRAYLLKRKALTTGFFTDSKSKEDKEKESSGGLVFGISLSQCLENDRLARIAAGEIVDVGCLSRNSRHGSRTSFTSLIETTTASKTDEGGSCESLSSKAGSGALTSSDSGVLGELSDSLSPPAEFDAVPIVVKQCIRHLENTGLRTLGIFRVSPSKKRVRQLREDWDCGRETKIGPDQCPHDVAALLKEYFRDLPDPLLCRDLYQAFVHTQKIRNRRLQQEALQHLIQLLPTPNRETLYALLNFLSEVAANSEDRKPEDGGEWLSGNKMDTTNLATVFAPNILHCVKPGQTRSELSAERAEERIDVINVVRALLEHVNELFILPAALLDELYLHMMDSHPAELDVALSRRVVEEVANVDDVELCCSETENYSVDENVSPTSPVTPTAGGNATTPGTRKLYSREECLHQSAGVGGDIGPKPRRPKRPTTRRKDESSTTTRSNSIDSGSSEDPPVDPRYKAANNSPMVITASLTIPMSGAFTLNLDDPDIPFIEDSAGQQQNRQPAPQPNAPPRRQRQRSVSGSEGGGGGGRHGSDSAVGSSATLSGDQAPSSPASWASSPPASPDSAVTAVSYIPDQPQLQRVSFTTSSEITRQIARSTSQQDATKPATPAHTPSITSIGGAVMRSKTADIERMIQISRAEQQPGVGGKQSVQGSTGLQQDSKKYTKRRYTDSRHQTRHIPDAESLAGNVPSATSLASRLTSVLHHGNNNSSSSASSGTGGGGVSVARTTQQPVWKRRELISSAPKERGRFF